jgi:Protein of unknown function (DUF1579)/Domain of unknown function (DUF4440)
MPVFWTALLVALHPAMLASRPAAQPATAPTIASTSGGTGGAVAPISPSMRRLSGLAGSWAVVVRGRAAPTDTFTTGFSSSSITPVHGGAFLQEHVDMPVPNGGAIALMGILGYDRFRSTYRFAWLDDTFALFDVHEGAWNSDQLVVNNLRSGTSLKQAGVNVYSQMVWRGITPNRFLVESQASLDSGATWFTQAEASYERTGPSCERTALAADDAAIQALELEGAQSNVRGFTAARARAFFSPDWRGRQPDGSVMTLPDVLARFRNGRSIPWASRFEITRLTVRVYCDVAHVVGWATAHPLGAPSTLPPLQFHYTNVWRRDGSTWRYADHRHTMSGPKRP